MDKLTQIWIETTKTYYTNVATGEVTKPVVEERLFEIGHKMKGANYVRRNSEAFRKLFNTNTVPWKYYYDLIRTVYHNDRFAGCHWHHIMPRCAFKSGLVSDEGGMMNSPYNTCFVTIQEHCVLHYCLYLCARDTNLKEVMNFAWSKLAKKCGLTRQELKRIVYGKIQ